MHEETLRRFFEGGRGPFSGHQRIAHQLIRAGHCLGLGEMVGQLGAQRENFGDVIRLLLEEEKR